MSLRPHPCDQERRTAAELAAAEELGLPDDPESVFCRTEIEWFR
jgi:hypothetical protein